MDATFELVRGGVPRLGLRVKLLSRYRRSPRPLLKLLLRVLLRGGGDLLPSRCPFRLGDIPGLASLKRARDREASEWRDRNEGDLRRECERTGVCDLRRPRECAGEGDRDREGDRERIAAMGELETAKLHSKNTHREGDQEQNNNNS
ncbi:predicted protein [Histoplasma mississippiense (nom. inval.)]|uniref:predicted protein n=1 Tax=Ajellomyces capsulatus (strain NAm1 / WU24) TaxID=2059318 RepID=UPI000157CFE9|nr:predicted protein [Histoplasma mississippiense (nom. inval.)]EDN11209.1 predicted protein [Histoplasma mississippiense (nom. inval.)]